MTATEDRALAPHMSYSQLASYTECGQRYYLERVRGNRPPSNTWWSTLAGTALHAVTEQYDLLNHMGLGMSREEAKALLPIELSKAMSEQKERYPDDEVKASGRVTKTLGWTGSPTKKDRAWVEHFLPIMLDQYIDWREETQWELADYDGHVGVELPLNVAILNEATGEVFPVRGYIDRVFRVPFRGDVIVDIKSGAVPASVLQLATYAAGIETQYGVRPKRAAYWSPSAKGGQYQEHKIVDWDSETLSQMYLDARKGMEAGIFLPTVTDRCKGCSVREYCWAFSGKSANSALLELDKANGNIETNSLPSGSIPEHGKE